MRINSAYKPLVRELRARGYLLRQSKGAQHIHVLTPEGKYLTSLSSTSSDRRAALNARSHLRKLGALT